MSCAPCGKTTKWQRIHELLGIMVVGLIVTAAARFGLRCPFFAIRRESSAS